MFSRNESKAGPRYQGVLFDFSVILSPFSPDTGEYGVANSLVYYYTPPVGFFGRDEISFEAVVRNRRVESWRDWCGSKGTVNIFVYPPQVNFKVQTGRCSDSDERHTGVIYAEAIAGVDFYKIFRDGEVIDTITTDEERFNRNVRKEGRSFKE